MLPPEPEMYQALLRKDSSYEGIFFVGVKTTGIFCRPSCTARKPKAENVEYFASVKEALAYGYRACKVCRPLQSIGEYPDWLQPLMREVDANPGLRLRDAELRARGLEPARLRRWFLKHYHMTFQAYLRSHRINLAFGLIRFRHRVTDAALDSGYESLSGFHQAFKKMTGFNPMHSKENSMITLTRLETPLGPMFAAASDAGLCLLEFTDRRMLETQFERLKKLMKAEIVTGRIRYSLRSTASCRNILPANATTLNCRWTCAAPNSNAGFGRH